MKKHRWERKAGLLALALLGGCAGLDVTFDARATYKTDELIAKQVAERAREDRRTADLLQALQK